VQKKHVMSPINFNLPLISNFEKHIDSYSEPQLTGKVNQTEFSIDVDSKPFHDTLETLIDISLTNIQVPYYFAYVPEDQVSFQIHSGILDLHSQVVFMKQGEDTDIELKGNIGLTNLEMKGPNGASVFKLPKLTIDVAPSRPMKNQINLASIKIQSPELYASRNREGIINLATLGPKSPESPESPETNTENTGTKH